MEKYYFVELRAHSFSKTYLVSRCELHVALVFFNMRKSAWGCMRVRFVLLELDLEIFSLGFRSGNGGIANEFGKE